MGLSVVTNTASLSAHRALTQTDRAMGRSLERLSSGFRINRAADDAAGLAVSEGLRAQLGGMRQAVRNSRDAISVLQTAEGALAATTALLQRMRDLAVQAANDGALDDTARAGVQTEVDQLKAEVDRIAATTSFNGRPLLDGDYTGHFQVGANAGETLTVAIGSPGAGMSATDLGLEPVDVTGSTRLTGTVTAAVSDAEGTPAAGSVALTGDDFLTGGALSPAYARLTGTITYNGRSFDLSTVDYSGATHSGDQLVRLHDALSAALGTSLSYMHADATTLTFVGDAPAPGSTPADAAALTPRYSGPTGADGAIGLIDAAIARVSSTRAELGAAQNRLEHTIARLGVSIENTAAAESRIRDTDMAAETTVLTRVQVLAQAGTAMLAHANQTPQNVLKLLG
ncbi:flagellin N-terminal helical domain-containing protein [Modestobacter sp. SYSU DS0657]